MERIKCYINAFWNGLSKIGLLEPHNYLEGIPKNAQEATIIRWNKLGSRLRASANKVMEQYT